jgi:hypothetical protein
MNIPAQKPLARRCWLAILALCLWTAANQASGQTSIISNLSSQDAGVAVPLSSATWVAASFTMGSVPYTLSDVQVRLSGTVASSTFYEIESNSSGKPSGTVVSAFTDPTFSGSAATTYPFNAASSIILSANTTYWLVGGTTSGTTSILAGSSGTLPSGSGATFGSYAVTTNGGTTWGAAGPFLDQKIQLDGVADVPEPETSAEMLGGATLVVAGCYRRWRRAVKSADPA